MLELQLPQPMPHAVSSERPFNYFPHPPTSKHEQTRLPLPKPSSRADPIFAASGPRRPLTPPTDMPSSAVGPISLYQHGTRRGEVAPSSRGHNGTATSYSNMNGPNYQVPSQVGSRSIVAPPSPSSSRAQGSSQESAHRRKTSNNTIAPNLKTPATILTPQEGLPQLAAEVCHLGSIFADFENTNQYICRLRASSGLKTHPRSSRFWNQAPLVSLPAL